MRRTFTHLSILLTLLLVLLPYKTGATVRDKHAIHPSMTPRMAGMDGDMPPSLHRARKTSSGVDGAYTWT